MQLSLHTLAKAVGLHPPAEDVLVTGVAADSRQVRPGDLFVALPGNRVDGHDFAAQAVAAGAVAVLASRPLKVPAPVLVVSDVLCALGAVARQWREATRATVVAITGSAGKTTVKEALALTLAACGRVAKNPGNYNNQLGLPLSLLSFDGDEDFWVVELGISQPHDMDELGAIVVPDLALITNAGLAHAEALGGVEGVARHKARLFAWLRPGGIGVWNRRCPELHAACQATGRQGVTFAASLDGGPQAAATVQVLQQRVEPHGFAYHLVTPDAPIWIRTSAAAIHGESVAAVAAVVWALGLPLTAVEKGFLALPPQPGRFVPRTKGPWLIIDDTYNANPLSMGAAVAATRRVAGQRPLVFLLGEMRELGAYAAAAHRQLGELVRGAALVVFRGAHAAEVAEGFGSGRFVATDTPQEAWEAFLRLGLAEAVLLFKGSRGSRMEEFLAYFEERLS